MNIGADIGYAVGVGGIALTVVQHWTERRRARPVVITNEVQKRGITEGPKVCITNDSGVVAFNVRYGVNLNGVHVPWKHSRKDPQGSRVNVLAPGQREPSVGAHEIAVPDGVLFSTGPDQNPDDNRFYWAYYHGPGGDWWYTANPASRTEDLKIIRLRPGVLGWRKRKLERSLTNGETFIRQALADLREEAQAEETLAGDK